MLPPETQLVHATLFVSDLSATGAFYHEILGLEVLESTPGLQSLGSRNQLLLTLIRRPDLSRSPANAAGLYHLAFLYEQPANLAAALIRLAEKAPHLYEGSADHLVSQAFYLHDPEGNGIELYVDRPRNQWQYQDGAIVMGSLPLNPHQFIREHAGSANSGISLGHIHLKVGDIAPAKAFYASTLGFEVMAEMPSALFVAAGGYHHHIGLNTWESLGSGPRSESLGLAEFSINPPSTHLPELRQRLAIAGYAVEEQENRLGVQDPWNTKISIFTD